MNSARLAGRPALCLVVLLSLVTWRASGDPQIRLVSGFPFVVGETANGPTELADATPDGRFVLVTTEGNNLRGDIVDTNGRGDVYLLDRGDGSWDLVSGSFAVPDRTAGSGESRAKAVSDDGRFVLFASSALDLLDQPGNGVGQTYIFDRQARASRLISHLDGQPEAGGQSLSEPEAFSADGAYAVFSSSASGLVPGGGIPTASSLFLYDRLAGVSRLVTHRAGEPNAYANGAAQAAELSADGRYLLFDSVATDLVAGPEDTNLLWDTFVYDRQTGASELLSRNPQTPGSAAGGWGADLSPDGRYVLITSPAALEAGISDFNNASDCFLFDRQTATARLVSHSAISVTATGNGDAYCGQFSDDGRYVYYSSSATDAVSPFADRNWTLGDVYVFDRASGGTSLVSHRAGFANESGNHDSHHFFPKGPHVADEGRYLLYSSSATDLDGQSVDTPATDDLFLFDRLGSSSQLVSRIGNSAVAGGFAYRPIEVGAGGISYFSSSSQHDLGAPDANRALDAFVFDPAAGAASLLSATRVAGRRAAGAQLGGISADGRFSFWDGWYYDRITGANVLAGHRAGAPGTPAASTRVLAVGADGGRAMLDTEAVDLVAGVSDTNDTTDIYLYDRASGGLELVTHALGAPAVTANGESRPWWLSADGERMIFSSRAANLATDGNSFSNLYFYDRPSGQLERLTRHAFVPSIAGDGDSVFHGISADERWVVFRSNAQNLIENFTDNNGIEMDLFLFDRLNGTTTLISHRLGFTIVGSQSPSFNPFFNGDASFVYFQSAATDLAAGQDPQPGQKIFRWSRASGAIEQVRYLGNCGPSPFGSALQGITPDGRLMMISTPCSQVPSDNNSGLDVYVYDRVANSMELISHLPEDPGTAIGQSWGTSFSQDGRRVVYTDLGLGSVAAYSYDRASGQRTSLLLPSYFDPGTEFRSSTTPAVSRDGNYVLVSTSSAEVAPFDANDQYDYFLIELADLFEDGFENGTTAAWSQTVP